MSVKLIYFQVNFLCIFEAYKFNLMQNHRVFTQICVLQEFREKKQKSARKTTKKMAKVGNSECRDKFHYCRHKTQGKQQKKCHNNQSHVTTNIEKSP